MAFSALENPSFLNEQHIKVFFHKNGKAEKIFFQGLQKGKFFTNSENQKIKRKHDLCGLIFFQNFFLQIMKFFHFFFKEITNQLAKSNLKSLEIDQKTKVWKASVG